MNGKSSSGHFYVLFRLLSGIVFKTIISYINARAPPRVWILKVKIQILGGFLWIKILIMKN